MEMEVLSMLPEALCGGLVHMRLEAGAPGCSCRAGRKGCRSSYVHARRSSFEDPNVKPSKDRLQQHAIRKPLSSIPSVPQCLLRWFARRPGAASKSCTEQWAIDWWMALHAIIRLRGMWFAQTERRCKILNITLVTLRRGEEAFQH